MRDDHATGRRRILEWGKAEGKLEHAAREPVEITGSNGLPEEGWKPWLPSTSAPARNFAKSDATRAQLVQTGIAVKNTKQGVRWKRK